MRAFLLSAIILACTVITASAQSLTVFDVDTTQFPVMKAKFYALDASGQTRPSASEIRVTEDGLPRIVTSVTCPPQQPIPSLSVAMSIDISGSMSRSDFGDVPVELGKTTVRELVPRIADPSSEFALQTCNDRALIVQDFTTHRDRIISALGSVQADGGNDFVEELINPLTGLLNVAKTGKHRRIAMLYTDAWWGALSSSELQRCKDTCGKYGITFFAIIYTRTEVETRTEVVPNGIKASLRELAEATGGMIFDGVTSQDSAVAIASRLQQQAEAGVPCEITWESAVGCVTGERTLSFAWNGQTAGAGYVVPKGGVARLAFDSPSIYFKSKTVGHTFDTTLTITAINASFSMTSVTSTNPSYGITPQVFTLAAGESRTLTISYTPPDSGLTWTRFDFRSDICPQACYASGSYPGVRPKNPTLQLVQPNGGEMYIAGSDTMITWKGIPPDNVVALEYSTDNGSIWHIITERAEGGQHSWEVPKTPSGKCLMRVNQLGSNGWIRRAGGTNSDVAHSVALDPWGNIYVTGVFSGSADFGGITLTSMGFEETFIAKYHPDGSIEWAKRSGGKGGDGGNSIAVDASGNIYVAGAFSGTADFDGIVVNSIGVQDVFVAKYSSDGNVVWVKRAGGVAEESAYGVAVDQSGNVVVVGFFLGTANFGSIALTSAGGQDIFIAKYHPDGSIEWAKRAGGMKDYDNVYGIAVDATGNIYVTGVFSGSADFGSVILASAGQDDAFIAKYLPDGRVEWAKRAGGKGSEKGYCIAVDGSGHAYVTGTFTDISDFGGIALTNTGDAEIFVAKYRPDGNVDWAKRAGGIGYGICYGIAVDSIGDVYITGRFEGPVDFDSVTLSKGNSGAFVAKYHSDGSVAWVRHTTGGNGFTWGLSIATGVLGSVYVAGYFEKTVDFSEDTLTSAGTEDILIWKIGDDISQIDISDAVFSVVMPSPSSQDVDMRQVLVGSAKDSVIRTFVSNAGTYRFSVKSIQITGTDASQFSRVSGFPPFDVPANGSHPVEFRFRPTSVGSKSAQLRIITQTDTLLQTIRGEGVAPSLAVVSNVIDFGQLEIESSRDTTISLAIRNIGASPVDFPGAAQLGPDMTQFSLTSSSGAFTLAPGESRSVTIRFAPRFIGRTSGRIGFEYNGVGSPAVLQVFGQGLGGLVSVADDSAYAGEHRDIRLRVEKVKATSLQSVAATNFRARIAYDRTILNPVGGQVSKGMQYDTLTVTGSLGTDDVLARVPFVAMLGDNQVSPIDIVDFQWLDGQGTAVQYDVETQSGVFHLLGVCQAGGPRLLNPDGQVGILKIAPNPAREQAELEIETLESGRTRVVMMDMLGREVETVFDGELVSGRHTLQLNTSMLGMGSYFIQLRTPTVVRTVRMSIVQ